MVGSISGRALRLRGLATQNVTGRSGPTDLPTYQLTYLDTLPTLQTLRPLTTYISRYSYYVPGAFGWVGKGGGAPLSLGSPTRQNKDWVSPLEVHSKTGWVGNVEQDEGSPR